MRSPVAARMPAAPAPGEPAMGDGFKIQAMDVDSNPVPASSESADSSTANTSTDRIDGGHAWSNGDNTSSLAFSNFMQGFWDLSSVEVPKRIAAATTIVRHVSGSKSDPGYAMRRLVRGVCSSREAARQGFASCLVQVLITLSSDDLATTAVLEEIMRVTQTTSAMKGAEERDLILGRLLGVSALALSGRLRTDAQSAEEALRAVAEIYGRRKWLAQAAGEAALLVASNAFQEDEKAANVMVPLLTPLLNAKDGSKLQVADLSPDQLLLALGLRSIIRDRELDQKSAAMKQGLPSFLRHASVVRLGKTQDLIPALKQSASVFPKVHAVWGRLWDDIGLAPAGQPRASLTPKRLARLGEVWSVVVDGTLTSTSINNKGTAILLLKEVLRRVPAAGVCHVLSPGVVRIILNHTKDEESHLFSLVRLTLEQLPGLVDDDQEVQAQAAACLLQRGSIRFDARVGVKVVTSLVDKMGQEALDAHMNCLKELMRGKSGWAQTPDRDREEFRTAAKGSSKGPEVNEADEALEGDEASGDSAVERLQAVEALYTLTRRVQAHGRCERLQQTAEFLLDVAFFVPADEGTALAPLPPKVLDLCRSKFFSLVADIAAHPFYWRNDEGHQTSAARKESAPTEAQAIGSLEALWRLHEAWQGLDANGRKLADDIRIGVEEREACALALAAVRRVREKSMRASSKTGQEKIGAAIAAVLLVVSLHLLEAGKDDRGEERSRYIADLVETYHRMSGTLEVGNEQDGTGEAAEANGDPDPLAMLADVLIAVVAEPTSHSIRGLRDTARRAWGIICGTQDVTKGAVDTLLAAICGEDEADAVEGGDGSASSSDEGEYESDDEEESDDTEAGWIEDEKNGGEEQALDDRDKDRRFEQVDSESDTEPDVFDEKDGLVHHAGADKALGALLNLKKARRKKGAQEAKRQEDQIRLRALDLLEVLCSRQPGSQHLVAALLPVLNTIKALESRTRGQNSTGETSALNTRLQTLYKGRLCKCKPHGKDGAPQVIREAFASQQVTVFKELLDLCGAWSANAPLASLAFEGALCCLRWLKGRANKQLHNAMCSLATVVRSYFQKKRGGGLTPVQIEMVAQRFPEKMAPIFVEAASGAAVSDYLRTEAFSHLAGILQRSPQMDASSREALKEQYPSIFRALRDVCVAVAARATATGNKVDSEEQDTSHDIGIDKARAMLKAKRLKPMLLCLSSTLRADDNGKVLSIVTAEARELRRALDAIGDASASLPMQVLCNRVAQELDEAFMEDVAGEIQLSPQDSGPVEDTGGSRKNRSHTELVSGVDGMQKNPAKKRKKSKTTSADG